MLFFIIQFIYILKVIRIVHINSIDAHKFDIFAEYQGQNEEIIQLYLNCDHSFLVSLSKINTGNDVYDEQFLQVFDMTTLAPGQVSSSFLMTIRHLVSHH